MYASFFNLLSFQTTELFILFVFSLLKEVLGPTTRALLWAITFVLWDVKVVTEHPREKNFKNKVFSLFSYFIFYYYY